MVEVIFFMAGISRTLPAEDIEDISIYYGRHWDQSKNYTFTCDFYSQPDRFYLIACFFLMSEGKYIDCIGFCIKVIECHIARIPKGDD
ncbi:hypothetical protein MNBD_GAMMA09-388 [hydrothermal vent metagenome]|uniref:Uncharacterized protein n=1 Tax=hydrothermal vent metagenome TaxID=652676 RepID=A0A3B0XJQ4_9ZZZZ